MSGNICLSSLTAQELSYMLTNYKCFVCNRNYRTNKLLKQHFKRECHQKKCTVFRPESSLIKVSEEFISRINNRIKNIDDSMDRIDEIINHFSKPYEDGINWYTLTYIE